MGGIDFTTDHCWDCGNKISMKHTRRLNKGKAFHRDDLCECDKPNYTAKDMFTDEEKSKAQFLLWIRMRWREAK